MSPSIDDTLRAAVGLSLANRQTFDPIEIASDKLRKVANRKRKIKTSIL